MESFPYSSQKTCFVYRSDSFDYAGRNHRLLKGYGRIHPDADAYASFYYQDICPTRYPRRIPLGPVNSIPHPILFVRKLRRTYKQNRKQILQNKEEPRRDYKSE